MAGGTLALTLRSLSAPPRVVANGTRSGVLGNVTYTVDRSLVTPTTQTLPLIQLLGGGGQGLDLTGGRLRLLGGETLVAPVLTGLATSLRLVYRNCSGWYASNVGAGGTAGSCSAALVNATFTHGASCRVLCAQGWDKLTCSLGHRSASDVPFCFAGLQLRAVRRRSDLPGRRCAQYRADLRSYVSICFHLQRPDLLTSSLLPFAALSCNLTTLATPLHGVRNTCTGVRGAVASLRSKC